MTAPVERALFRAERRHRLQDGSIAAVGDVNDLAHLDWRTLQQPVTRGYLTPVNCSVEATLESSQALRPVLVQQPRRQLSERSATRDGTGQSPEALAQAQPPRRGRPQADRRWPPGLTGRLESAGLGPGQLSALARGQCRRVPAAGRVA
jgi:hypothetical protein